MVLTETRQIGFTCKKDGALGVQLTSGVMKRASLPLRTSVTSVFS
jgi:hypothetical protein